MQWRPHSGQGTLFSWTVVHKATAKGFADVPYGVLIVSLDDAPDVRVLGNLAGNDFSVLKVGMPLVAGFVPAGPVGEVHLVQWKPVPKR